MFLVAASLVAGLGLFFVGLYFLTEHLNMLSGRRLRERIAAWTKNPFMRVLWGGVFIAVTQSTAAKPMTACGTMYGPAAVRKRVFTG